LAWSADHGPRILHIMGVWGRTAACAMGIVWAALPIDRAWAEGRQPAPTSLRVAAHVVGECRFARSAEWLEVRCTKGTPIAHAQGMAIADAADRGESRSTGRAARRYRLAPAAAAPTGEDLAERPVVLTLTW